MVVAIAIDAVVTSAAVDRAAAVSIVRVRRKRVVAVAARERIRLVVAIVGDRICPKAPGQGRLGVVASVDGIRAVAAIGRPAAVGHGDIVVSRAGIDGIGAGRVDIVVAVAGIDAVAAACAPHRVVAVAAEQQVAARPAVKRIVASAAVERVGAVTAEQRLVRRAACQRVGIRRAVHHLDVGKRVVAAPAVRRSPGAQIHHHASGTVGVVNGVRAVPAVQRVVTAAADQRVVAVGTEQAVVAAVADQQVVAAIADQRVVLRRADQILDVRQRVAKTIAIIGVASAEIGIDRARRSAVIGGVHPAAAIQAVVAGAAGQYVVVGVTQQRVVIGRADDVLDVRQGVGVAPAIGRRTVREINENSIGVLAVVGRVGARAAVQRVVAGIAGQQIVAVIPLQQVVGGVTQQRIGIGRADDVLDVRQGVGVAPAIGRGTVREIDENSVGVLAVVGGVHPAAAVQAVVTAAAHESVVAVVTQQRVVITRAGHPLNADQTILVAPAVGRRAARKIDVNKVGVLAVVGDVRAGAAVQCVVAGIAGQQVVAVAALQQVVIAVTQQRVLIGRADDVLDVRQDVGVAPAIARPACREIDDNSARVLAVVRRVDAAAAVQAVVTCATLQDIVARAAGERVVADVAGDGRVEVVAGQRQAGCTGIRLQGFDLRASGNGIADAGIHRVKTLADILGDHIAGAADEVGVVTLTAGQRVVAGSADQRVIAVAAAQAVVSRAAVQPVGCRIAGNRVRIAGANHVLDIGDGVGTAPAVGRGAGGKVDRHACRVVGVADRVRVGAAVDAVIARAADQRIVAAAAQERVVATGAEHQVVAGAAVQQLGRAGVERRRRRCVEDGEHVDPGDAGVAHRGRQQCVVDRPVAERSDVGRRTGPVVVENVPVSAVGEVRCAKLVISSLNRLIAECDIELAVAGAITDQLQLEGILVGRVDVLADIVPGDGNGVVGCVEIVPDFVRPGRSAAGSRRPCAIICVEVRAQRRDRPTLAEGDITIVGNRHRRDGVAEEIEPGATEYAADIDRPVGVVVAAWDGIGTEPRRSAEPVYQFAPDGQIAGGRCGQRRPGAAGAIQHVVAVAAAQRVRPAAAGQRVVPRAAVQQIGVGIAGDGIGIGRANHVLDIQQGIGVAPAVGRRARRQIDRNRGRIVGVNGRVGSGSTIQRVGTSKAVERIVALQPIDLVRTGRSGQAVIPTRAIDDVQKDGHGCCSVPGRGGTLRRTGRTADSERPGTRRRAGLEATVGA